MRWFDAYSVTTWLLVCLIIQYIHHRDHKTFKLTLSCAHPVHKSQMERQSSQIDSIYVL